MPTMGDEIQFEYRGERIFYNDSGSVWTWRSPSEVKESQSLRPIKAAIDAFCKNEWNGVKAYLANYSLANTHSPEAKLVEITGRTPNGNFWIKRTHRREEIQASQIVECSPENEAILKRIVEEIPLKQKAVTDELSALIASLKRIGT